MPSSRLWRVLLALLLLAALFCVPSLVLTGCCFANKLRKFFKQSAKKKRRLKGF